ERKESVSCELLDIALVAAHDAAETADDRVDHLEQLLGIQPIGKSREAGDVCEERRHKAAFLRKLAAGFDQPLGDGLGDEAAQHLCDLRVRICGHCGAAVAAEAHSLWVLALARRAYPRRHRLSLERLSRSH